VVVLAGLFGCGFGRIPAAPIMLEIRRGGLAGILLGALLLASAGLLATLLTAWARYQQGSTFGHAARRGPALVAPQVAPLRGYADAAAAHGAAAPGYDHARA
jgi:hypothetical protein